MRVIIGLGNPPREYGGTRHNVGAEVVDLLAQRMGCDVRSAKFHSLVGDGYLAGRKVLLAKPMTYMNLSGRAVRAVADYYDVSPEEILLVYDDVHLDLGRIRLRQGGSAGGHNGMQSVIDHLGTRDIPRLRIGIGCAVSGRFMRDHVLSRFSASEREILDPALAEAADACEEFVAKGIESAMNRFNTRLADVRPDPGE